MEPSSAIATRRRSWFLSFAAAAIPLLPLIVLNLGIVRFDPQNESWEWHNGWPLLFLSRNAGFDRSQPERDAWAPGAIIRFSAVGAALDGLLAACTCTVVFVVTRRRWASRRPQFGLRGLLIAVLGVAGVLGWGLHVQRRQARAVRLLEREDIFFGFMVDEGLPHCLRRWLPGGELRPFDQIAWVTCGGPKCVDQQMAALADLHSVAAIEIIGDEIRDPALSYIAPLHNLACLRIAGARHIGDDGVANLSNLRRLTTLQLGSCEITDRGVASLAQLTRLEDLGLPFCRISDAGLQHLANMHHLRRLMLTESDITDASIPVLAGFKKLELLDVRRTRMTSRGVARLKQSLPGCQVLGPG